MSHSKKIVIVGGGAAGFFAAINHKEKYPDHQVVILEQSTKFLSKVKISGGGRCNVSHACFKPTELAKNYPRGQKELLNPFKKFQAQDTISWFENRGIELKIEADKRIFPVSDDSQTIIDCFFNEIEKLKIEVLAQTSLEFLSRREDQWLIQTNKQDFIADAILFATGSSPRTWKILELLGHTIIKPVPSLFTFNISDQRIKDLAGISVKNGIASLMGTKISQNGAILITHWGLTAPAILKLSAWAARELAEKNYEFELRINWTPEFNAEQMKSQLLDYQKNSPKKIISSHPLFELPSRLWNNLLKAAEIPETMRWTDASHKAIFRFAEQLTLCNFQVQGKSNFKEEFVTCGGIKLSEVDMETMQSKLLPNIFFAGEVLDIDAVTGGFNFQAAWTTSWIAAQNM